MKYPLISVIIPVFNVEDYLYQCVTSVINQTYNNLEIILIDDGSEDSSGKICDNLRMLDYRIKVVHQKNMGLSGARNTGLDIANGEYIAFVDSDDWIDSRMYEILYKGLRNAHADIAQCSFYKTRNSTNRQKNLKEKYEYQIIDSNEAQKRMYQKKFLEYIVVWNKLYSSSLFKTIRFPIGKINEDEFVNYKLYFQSKKIITFTVPLYYYRQRLGSIMNKRYGIKNMDAIEALCKRTDFYAGKEMFSLYTYAMIYKNDLIRNGLEKVRQDKLDWNLKVKLYWYFAQNFKVLLYWNKLNKVDKKKLLVNIFMGEKGDI